MLHTMLTGKADIHAARNHRPTPGQEKSLMLQDLFCAIAMSLFIAATILLIAGLT